MSFPSRVLLLLLMMMMAIMVIIIIVVVVVIIIILGIGKYLGVMCLLSHCLNLLLEYFNKMFSQTALYMDDKEQLI